MNDKIYNSRKNFEKLGTVYDKAENVTIKKRLLKMLIVIGLTKKKE